MCEFWKKFSVLILFSCSIFSCIFASQTLLHHFLENQTHQFHQAHNEATAFFFLLFKKTSFFLASEQKCLNTEIQKLATM